MNNINLRIQKNAIEYNQAGYLFFSFQKNSSYVVNILYSLVTRFGSIKRSYKYILHSSILKSLESMYGTWDI